MSIITKKPRTRRKYIFSEAIYLLFTPFQIVEFPVLLEAWMYFSTHNFALDNDRRILSTVVSAVLIKSALEF